MPRQVAERCPPVFTLPPLAREVDVTQVPPSRIPPLPPFTSFDLSHNIIAEGEVALEGGSTLLPPSIGKCPPLHLLFCFLPFELHVGGKGRGHVCAGPRGHSPTLFLLAEASPALAQHFLSCHLPTTRGREDEDNVRGPPFSHHRRTPMIVLCWRILVSPPITLMA